jgi:hypothetical protein
LDRGEVVDRGRALAEVEPEHGGRGWRCERGDVHECGDALGDPVGRLGDRQAAHGVPDEQEPLESGGVGVLEHGVDAAGDGHGLRVEGAPASSGKVDGDRGRLQQRCHLVPAPGAVHPAVNEHDPVDRHPELPRRRGDARVRCRQSRTDQTGRA